MVTSTKSKEGQDDLNKRLRSLKIDRGPAPSPAAGNRSPKLLLLGIAVVLALPLNFVSTGTSNWVTFSEIAFNFRVTYDLMLIALAFGGVIGLIGSLLPSIRASRFKIVDALRA